MVFFPEPDWRKMSVNIEEDNGFAIINFAYKGFPYKEIFPWFMFIEINISIDESLSIAELGERIAKENKIGENPNALFFGREHFPSKSFLLMRVHEPKEAEIFMNKILNDGIFQFSYIIKEDHNWDEIGFYMDIMNRNS